MSYALDIKVLARLEPIAAFGAVRLRELLDYCHIEKVAQGANPFALYDLHGQSVYLLAGELELQYQDGNVVRVNASSEWAKHPLGKRQPDIVLAQAICDSQLLRIDDELLDRMMTWDQFANHAFHADTQGNENAQPADLDSRRLFGSTMFSAENLQHGPFAHLPAANIGELIKRIETVVVWGDDVIVREGDAGDYYYLIDTGKAVVTRRVGGVDLQLAELQAGDVFGEEALVSDATRNATVTMQTNGVLLRLNRQDFLHLLQEPLLHKISFKDAAEAVAAGTALWLDVRHPPEYRYDRLAGALNIPLNDIRNAIGVLSHDKQYIVYCQSGRRSAAAAFILAQAGYQVHVLEGGLWSVPHSQHA
ncbi:MAG: cyclic nucleotide-binding domain-containing protein [Gallionella sp.]